MEQRSCLRHVPSISSLAEPALLKAAPATAPPTCTISPVVSHVEKLPERDATKVGIGLGRENVGRDNQLLELLAPAGLRPPRPP
jgi:hypothetical protein